MKEEYATLGEQGRLVIPARYRKALQLQPGDKLLIRVEDDEIRLVSRRHAVARAKQLVRQYAGKGAALSNKLISERRKEAERE